MIQTRKSFFIKSFCVLFLLIFTQPAIGQSLMPGSEKQKDLNFVIAPYFWFAGLNGQLGVANIEADVDAGFSDIFSNLNIGFMIYGEARYKRFGIAVDLLTLSMSLEGTRPIIGGVVKVDPKTTFLETSLLFSFIHDEKWSVDVHAGIRTWWLNTRLEAERIIGEENRIAESSLSWVDPIIGVKAIYLPDEKWPINARVDIGGFGLGSQFTWQVFAGAGFRFAKSWTALLQYRFLGVDYRNGTEGTIDYFKLDVTKSGPLIGVMATF